MTKSRPFGIYSLFVSLLTALVLFMFPTATQAQQSRRAYTPLSTYEVHNVEGFKVFVNPKVHAHPEEARRGYEIVKSSFSYINRVMKKEHLKLLQRVALVIEWEAKTEGGAAHYNKSREWLRDNGYDPAKAGTIEINNLRSFIRVATTDQPMTILHELAHAYHNQVLGINYEDILAAYRRAVRSRRYDVVLRSDGKKLRAFALNNHEEFFAELTEAYFGRNDWYPFTASELKAHDPESYALIEKIWSSEPPKEPKE